MSGDSWRGEEKDPAMARAKSFENLQEIAARIEKAQKRRDAARQELNSAAADLVNAEEVYRKAKAEFEDRLPCVSEPPEMHPA